jgi:hypothetical protein
MIDEPNPFPDYPVASLESAAAEDPGPTVETPAIAQAKALVDRYIERFDSDGDRRGLNASVRGEFGAGKTHLLGYAERCLRDASRERDVVPGIIAVSAMETTPGEWYRAAIGPQIGALHLERVVLELYAEAATVVARSAPLTAAAASYLEEDPASAQALVEQDLLNSTSIELELSAILERIAPGVGREVRGGIEGLLSEPRPSLRWLEGEDLSDREAIATGLREALASDRLAADAIVAIAAIHSSLGRPFLLLVDEFEHLVRFDERAGGKPNMTWFKRLLERLERAGAMVFVAGHLSTWEGHPDYLDRFSPDAAIEMAPLDGADVMRIVDHFEKNGRGAFTLENAELVSQCARGNIRHVLGILKQLHDRSEGFASDLSGEAISAVSVESANRLDPEKAVDELARSLSQIGLRVSHNAAVSAVSFDLVAHGKQGPAVVVEVKHALYGKKQQEQAQRFIDKLRVVNREAPGCLGVFVSEGGLDASLLAIDPSEARIFWFDLTQTDFAEEARRVLEPALAAEPNAPADQPAATERDAALSALADEIQAVKDAQAAAYEELADRLSTAAPEGSELTFNPPSQEETHDERRRFFEELSQRPPLIGQLALIPGLTWLLVSLLVALGIGSIALASPIASASATSSSSYALTRVLMYLGGAVAVIASIFVVVRQLLLLNRFYVAKEGRLRDIYVLEFPIEELIETNQIIDNCLDRYGPRYGLLEVTKALDNRAAVRAREERGAL